jgi:hypothetical protein
VQLPQDPAKDLPVVAPRLATPTVDGQQGLHHSERLVSELQHPAASWLVDFQERDATQRHHH